MSTDALNEVGIVVAFCDEEKVGVKPLWGNEPAHISPRVGGEPRIEGLIIPDEPSFRIVAPRMYGEE